MITNIEHNTTTPAESKITKVTKKYNTGVMVGDIRLATLSDTTAEAITSVDGVVDRSLKGNNLQVVGELTKAPVATGAELVAYSGFSATDYIEQPYNSDLDFGTGDFCVMGWVNSTYSGGYPQLLERRKTDSTGNRILVGMWTSNIGFQIINDALDTVQVVPAGRNDADGNWHLVVVKRTGGFVFLNIDATPINNVAITGTLTANNQLTVLGNDVTYELPSLSTLLANWRISATAPTDAEILDIYNQEKKMFQEDAKCTLQGTSTSVQALSYNEDTSKLYAGTSDGITVFDGLTSEVQESSGNIVAIDYSSDDSVVGTTTSVFSGYTIETIEHPGNEFNNSETSFAPETKPVGSPNGTDDDFTMDTDHGTIISYGGTAVPTYVHPTITFTTGTIRNILFSDGVLIPVDEGEGLVIKDSLGNIVGTYDVTIPTFWEGEPMVSQELGDADIAADALYFTDGLYHPVEKTQAEWVSDGVINYDKQRYLTDCEGKPPQLLIYKDPRTTAEDAAIKLFDCIGE